MAVQQMQENRFELKYVIDEACAHGIRNFVRSYLEPDAYADPYNEFSYPIHSIYLDNKPLELFYATVHGEKNRFKLRVRYYDENPSHPAFFEIKRRVSDVILKRRAAVKKECVASLLRGHWPRREDLVKPDDVRSYDALQMFCDLRERINAGPKCIVCYIREAWVTPENNAIRVTFDRQISGLAFDGALTTRGLRDGVRPEIGGVVLELKFTDRFPTWMRDMVRTFNLWRGSMAKYVRCTEALHTGRGLRPVSRFEAAV